MSFDQTPIQHFVTQRFLTKDIQKLVDGWRVEPRDIIEKVVDHFREMAIYRVPYTQEDLITDSITQYLKSSPDIIRLVLKARNEEMRRQRNNRHSG